MILLISPTGNFDTALTEPLTALTHVTCLKTIAEAIAELQKLSQREQYGAPLILFDVSELSDPAAECATLCQNELTAEVPIIAVLQHIEHRKAVLATGIDDYLLRPLSSLHIKARLAPYLHSAFQGFNSLTDIINQLSKGSGLENLDNSLEDLARTFHADRAWLSLLQENGLQIVARYNIDSLSHAVLEETDKQSIAQFQEKHSFGLKIVDTQCCETETEHVVHLLGVALRGKKSLMGVLNFGYAQAPALTRAERRTMSMLGRDAGSLLEVYNLQQEIQTHATQTAFILLLSRMISESMELNTILGQILEHTTALLNAAGGGIWLPSPDGEWLDLASSLSASFVPFESQRRAVGQGLIGWVIEAGQALHSNAPRTDSRYDAQVDRFSNDGVYTILAVPLRHHQKTIGALAIYKHGKDKFTNRDTVLLEGIASLGAAAIANAQMMRSLWNYAQQRQVLYEMSQEIAAGLEFEPTVNRALAWATQLVEAEIGSLWLMEELSEQQHLTHPTKEAQANASYGKALQLVAGLGFEMPPVASRNLPLSQGIIGRVAQTQQSIVINDFENYTGDIYLNKLFRTFPRNLVAVPMICEGQISGVLNLVNKKEGSFSENDLTLLGPAVEIITIAISNARLHSKTVNLIEEREQLYQQAIGAERLATIGRLTGSLSHEINNPMQAIRGALSLALEDLDDPEELEMYINLCLEESERVVQLIDRMRQIYRPSTDNAETVGVNKLVQDAIFFAQKELRRQKVQLQLELADNLPSITVIINQLHLVFVNSLLNLGIAIGQKGGGKLMIRSYVVGPSIVVQFLTKTQIFGQMGWSSVLQKNALLQNDMGLSLSFSHDIIAAHGGEVAFRQEDGTTVFMIKLPKVTAHQRRRE